MIPQIHRNRKSNASDLLVLQIDNEVGYSVSLRIPRIVGETMLVCFEALRPYFIKPESIDQIKKFMQSLVKGYHHTTS